MSLVRRPCRATSLRVGSNPRFAPGHPRAGPSLPSALAPPPGRPAHEHRMLHRRGGPAGRRGASSPPSKVSSRVRGAETTHSSWEPRLFVPRAGGPRRGPESGEDRGQSPRLGGEGEAGAPEPLGQMRPDITRPCSPDARGKGFPAAQVSFPRRKIWPRTGVCGRNGKGEFESPCRRPSAKLEPLFLKITPHATKLWLLKGYLRRGSRRRIRELLILC